MPRLVPIRNDIKKHIRLLKANERRLSKEAGKIAIEHFKENFQQEGFVDMGTPQKWKPRKNNRDPKRPILTKTRRLRHGFRLASVQRKKVIVRNKVPYGIKHQEGRGKLPVRKFVGQSSDLDVKTNILIRKHINSIVHPR